MKARGTKYLMGSKETTSSAGPWLCWELGGGQQRRVVGGEEIDGSRAGPAMQEVTKPQQSKLLDSCSSKVPEVLIGNKAV